MQLRVPEPFQPFHRSIAVAHLRNLRDVLSKLVHDVSASETKHLRGVERQLLSTSKDLKNADLKGRHTIETHDTHVVSPRPTGAGGLTMPESPREVHMMWTKMSRSDKDELHKMDPFIGNRDGIPQHDRDHYNRQTLRILRENSVTARDFESTAHYDLIERALESRPGSPQRYLSALDRKFRCSIAVGNPDNAKNVVTNVIGAESNPSGIRGWANVSESLRRSAIAADPAAETSVIAWAGYDRPPTISRAIDPKYAREAAPRLVRHQEGLAVTNNQSPPHRTVVGHSYGSLVAGSAASHGLTLPADNLVFTGSFGVGANYAKDLSLTGTASDISRRVFATMAEHDSIQLMPRPHGPLPTTSDFGGTVFATDSSRGPWTSLGWNSDAHDSYWSSTNSAMQKMGLIVTGHGHLAM